MTASRIGLSIPTRIFISFALALSMFGVVATASILQHQRSAETMHRLHEGYLPLAIDVAEARANQVVFATLVDRILEESDSSATRGWLSAARRARPVLLHHVLSSLDRVERMNPPDDEAFVLRDLRRELKSVEDAYRADDAEFESLSHSLVANDRDHAEKTLSTLRAKERVIERSLRHSADSVQHGLADMSANAAETERRSMIILGILALAAAVAGFGISLWARRILSPLSTLQERVVAVARGDLSPRLLPQRDDEIGQLTAEFERMVDALGARDARLRDAAETELRTKEQLLRSERLAAIGRMAAHVTHEVRNPLSSIGLNVEMLEEETVDAGPEVRSLLRAIHREIDRLTAVTEEYLRLARLPSPRLVVSDVRDLVQEVAEFVRAECRAANVELRVPDAPQIPSFAFDEMQVRQALLNLIRNAREVSESGGGIDLIVRVQEAVHDGASAHDEGGIEVAVEVADTGPGVPEEIRDRMFEPFFTTKEHGTGLGLSLTQQIMSAHGGRIECLPRVPHGTRFVLSFPVPKNVVASRLT